VRGAAVAGLGAILLLLTKQAAEAAEVSTVWKSTPRPLRCDKPGKLPRTQLWFNLENAEIAPGHVADVLQATLGGFPADTDAVLVHVMTWNGATPEPAKQHWALLDAHLRALPMSTLRTLRRISLLYVAYRHPAHMPVVYTLHEENPTATATNEIADVTEPDTGYSSLVWGVHKFTVAPDATRVSFLLQRSGPLADSPSANMIATKHFRASSYKYDAMPSATHYSLDFYSHNLQPNPEADASPFPHLTGWMANTARAANLGGDYSASNTVGLLQAGDGEAYQPVYTLWMTAGFGPPNARVYGGLVTQTMMVFHDNINNMNWGTSYGAGAGVHLEWQNKK
jgi:hypothetical protein